MAAKAPRTGNLSSSRLSDTYALGDIRVLAKILTQYDLSELEVEHGGQRIRLRRDRLEPTRPPAAPPALHPLVPEAPEKTQASSATSPAEAASDGTATISSPFVGTFYRAPSPEAPPFVNVGQTVKKGQVLCVVEAMKLMNEIEADSDCKIIEILVKNGEPVEYGQALFRVFPLA